MKPPIYPAWATNAAFEIAFSFQTQWSEQDLNDAASVIVKHTPINRSTFASIDETNAALIGAITQARDEMKAGRCIEAGITLTMALAEHKQRLVNLDKDTHAKETQSPSIEHDPRD